MEPDRKTQILKSAAKRFARHGLNKTTLDEIARDLRIGKATIYHYFKSKEDLFYKTLEYDASLFISDIKNIISNEEVTLKERLINYFNYKRGLKDKYKLLYDIILTIFEDEGLDKEKEILKNLIDEEEKVLKPFLKKLKDENIASPLSKFFLIQSWGILFGRKLYDLKENGTQDNDESFFSDFINIINSEI